MLGPIVVARLRRPSRRSEPVAPIKRSSFGRPPHRRPETGTHAAADRGLADAGARRACPPKGDRGNKLALHARHLTGSGINAAACSWTKRGGCERRCQGTAPARKSSEGSPCPRLLSLLLHSRPASSGCLWWRGWSSSCSWWSSRRSCPGAASDGRALAALTGRRKSPKAGRLGSCPGSRPQEGLNPTRRPPRARTGAGLPTDASGLRRARPRGARRVPVAAAATRASASSRGGARSRAA